MVRKIPRLESIVIFLLFSVSTCVQQCTSNELVQDTIRSTTNEQITEFITGGLTQIIWNRIETDDVQQLVSERCSQSIIEIIDGIESGQTSAYKCKYYNVILMLMNTIPFFASIGR